MVLVAEKRINFKAKSYILDKPNLFNFNNNREKKCDEITCMININKSQLYHFMNEIDKLSNSFNVKTDYYSQIRKIALSSTQFINTKERLDLQTQKEKYLKSELKNAILKRDHEVVSLNSLNEKIYNYQKNLEICLAAGQIEDACHNNIFLKKLYAEIPKQKKIVDEINLTVESLMKNLTNVLKESKVLEYMKSICEANISIGIDTFMRFSNNKELLNKAFIN